MRRFMLAALAALVLFGCPACSMFDDTLGDVVSDGSLPSLLTVGMYYQMWGSAQNDVAKLDVLIGLADALTPEALDSVEPTDEAIFWANYYTQGNPEYVARVDDLAKALTCIFGAGAVQ